jgi:hypothetical protein
VQNEEGKYFNLIGRQLMQETEVKGKSRLVKAAEAALQEVHLASDDDDSESSN